MRVTETDKLYRFQSFAQLVWSHLNLPPLTLIQREMCDWLQFGPTRCQMWAFRGAGKSYLTAAYVIHRLLINPEEKVLVLSASKDRSDAFVQFTRRLIEEMPILEHLKPRRDLRYRDSNVAFDVGCSTPSHSPSVKAAGITGQITGSRASTLILDDVEVPSNSDTPTVRAKLHGRVTEIEAIMMPADKELGIDPRIRVLGTPQSMETVYATLEEAGYVPRIWPVQTPAEDILAGYHGHMAPSIQAMMDEAERNGVAVAGIPTEPGRFTVEDLARRRLTYGAQGYALQFMLSTSLSDADRYPLKCYDGIYASFTPERVKEVYIHTRSSHNKLKDLDCPGLQGDGFFSPADEVGAWVEPDATVVSVDPSGRGADECAVVSGSTKSGYIFIHRATGFLSGYDEATLTAIAEEAKRVSASKILVESNFGDGMFCKLLEPILRRIYPVTVQEVKANVQKERRIIDTLSPVLEGHRLVFHEDVVRSDLRFVHEGDSDLKARQRRLFYQLSHITYERGCLAHDDRLDALAQLVEHFAPFISLDAYSEQRRRDEEEMKKMLEGGGYITANTGPLWSDPAELGTTSLQDPL